MADPDLVFVYGTLRPGAGHPLGARLQDEGRHEGRATWRGRLYSLGDYPAALRQAGHYVVHGDLFRLPLGGGLLATLDAYEGLSGADPPGDGYVREVAEVRREDGGLERSWVYRFTGPVASDSWIPSGDWLAHLAAGAPRHERSGRRVP